jgi:hypothetical protein
LSPARSSPGLPQQLQGDRPAIVYGIQRRCDTARPGRIGRKLSEDEKFALIEYLKAATYDNYPSEPRATEAAVACHDQPDWALTKAN